MTPNSPRMTKAAFFRARSPPISLLSNGMDGPGSRRDDLSSGFDALQAKIDPFSTSGMSNGNGRYTPDSSSEGGHAVQPSRGKSYRQETRETASKYRPQLDGRMSPTSPASLTGVMNSLSLESGYHAGPSSSSGGHGIVNGSLGHANGSTDHPANGNGVMRGRMGSIMSDEDDYGDGIERSGSTSGSTDIAGGSDEMLMTLLAGQAAVDCENLPVGAWEEVDAWKKASPNPAV